VLNVREAYHVVDL